MEVVIFALKLLAGAMIITPFVLFVGCALIQCWFQTRAKNVEKRVEEDEKS